MIAAGPMRFHYSMQAIEQPPKCGDNIEEPLRSNVLINERADGAIVGLRWATSPT